MKYRLMIKTHTITGLKYLCVTTRENFHRYSGSGVEWKKHLIQHGRKWTTELLFESNDIEEFSKVCINRSIEYDIVNSARWANSIVENGGGEYPVDDNGNKILRQSKKIFSSREEMEEFCRTAKWFECSVCGARMTENAFIGFRKHRKCKERPGFKMIPWNRNNSF